MLQKTSCRHVPRQSRHYRQENRRGRVISQIKQEDENSTEGSPSWEQWLERKGRVQTTRLSLILSTQRPQQRVILKVHPLTMADILDIVTAVTNTNRGERPAQVRTSRLAYPSIVVATLHTQEKELTSIITHLLLIALNNR